MAQELMALGLSKKQIPFGYGGEWKFDDFVKWCRQRKSWEQTMYRDQLLLQLRSRLVTQETENLSTTQSFVHGHDSGEGEEEKVREEERKKNRRLADMVHSRQKRERKQKEFKWLQGESLKLHEEHDALNREQMRLEQLLREAQEIEASMSHPRQK